MVFYQQHGIPMGLSLCVCDHCVCVIIVSIFVPMIFAPVFQRAHVSCASQSHPMGVIVKELCKVDIALVYLSLAPKPALKMHPTPTLARWWLL